VDGLILNLAQNAIKKGGAVEEINVGFILNNNNI
jgi:hypothetical protein